MKKIVILLLAILLLAACEPKGTVDPVDPVKKFTIEVAPGPNVTSSNTGSVEVISGTNLTVNFNLAQGYEVDNAQVDGVIVLLTNYAYTFLNVTASHKITVVSKIIPAKKVTAYDLLTMPKPFVIDSLYVRDLNTTNEWGRFKASYQESIFFYPDNKMEIFSDGKLIGNGAWSITSTDPLIINFSGKPWKVLVLDDKNLKVIFTSINSTSGDDIQYIFKRQ